ncbi:CpaF family protein [Shimazuella kribbensis]|uniref:CpaF family protein n=1 Tax=Shimazuella kribbensis TaxID=139808 RepID=UPI00040D5985|nr:CpaF family protein [Shimazuella kribbensis]
MFVSSAYTSMPSQGVVPRKQLDENRLDHFAKILKDQIVKEFNAQELTQLPYAEVRDRFASYVTQYLTKQQLVLSEQMKEAFITKIIHESVGYGPLETLLKDDSITEIIVNGTEPIYYEKNGVLHRSTLTFRNAEALMHVIDRIVAPLGRRIDLHSPMVDARLPDGSRVNAVIPPISLHGPLLSIRKFRKEPITISELVERNAMIKPMADLLTGLVQAKCNVLISGGTGSGKTTLLNALACHIPEQERLITIEDMAEMRITHPHVVSMEARPPNLEGKGEITIRHLVRNALRMRPDRIIVGEVRGSEAFDMLQAMNTGHEGSLTTVHSNSPTDAIHRLEGMVMMSGLDFKMDLIRQYIRSSIDIIVQLTRLPDGQRKVIAISEMMEKNAEISDIYRFVQSGISSDGKVEGYFTPTGYKPRALERLKAYGVSIPSLHLEPTTRERST